jgi:hypothetical protein
MPPQPAQEREPSRRRPWHQGPDFCNGIHIECWPHICCRFVGDQQRRGAAADKTNSPRIGSNNLAAFVSI